MHRSWCRRRHDVDARGRLVDDDEYGGDGRARAGRGTLDRRLRVRRGGRHRRDGAGGTGDQAPERLLVQGRGGHRLEGYASARGRGQPALRGAGPPERDDHLADQGAGHHGGSRECRNDRDPAAGGRGEPPTSDRSLPANLVRLMLRGSSSTLRLASTGATCKLADVDETHNSNSTRVTRSPRSAAIRPVPTRVVVGSLRPKPAEYQPRRGSVSPL